MWKCIGLRDYMPLSWIISLTYYSDNLYIWASSMSATSLFFQRRIPEPTLSHVGGPSWTWKMANSAQHQSIRQATFRSKKEYRHHVIFDFIDTHIQEVLLVHAIEGVCVANHSFQKIGNKLSFWNIVLVVLAAWLSMIASVVDMTVSVQWN